MGEREIILLERIAVALEKLAFLATSFVVKTDEDISNLEDEYKRHGWKF